MTPRCTSLVTALMRSTPAIERPTVVRSGRPLAPSTNATMASATGAGSGWA